MNWIRVSTTMADDPRVSAFAEALEVPVPHAGGLLVFLMAKLPAHAPTGDLTGVSDQVLERWAWWDGARGKFAAAFRATFLTDGVWEAWDKHNGAALQKLERDRERMAQARAARSEPKAESRDGRATVAGQSREGRGYVRDVRNERTAVSASSRINGNGSSRSGSGDLVPIRPHLPAVLVAPPFCATCEGEPVTAPSGRITGMRHVATCPSAAPNATPAREVTA